MRWLVVAAMAVMLTGAVAPAHATTLTYSTRSSLDVGSDHVTLGTAPGPSSSDMELESLALDLVPPTSNHDSSRQPSITTATPPPSMLLLVGAGLTGLAGMVRRRLARRQGIAW